jgi:hypothetical protein
MAVNYREKMVSTFEQKLLPIKIQKMITQNNNNNKHYYCKRKKGTLKPPKTTTVLFTKYVGISNNSFVNEER